LNEVRNDLDKNLTYLQRILYISKGNEDLPVAFAANALYVLERNAVGSKEDY